jgi:hypothetical protein
MSYKNLNKQKTHVKIIRTPIPPKPKVDINPKELSEIDINILVHSLLDYFTYSEKMFELNDDLMSGEPDDNDKCVKGIEYAAEKIRMVLDKYNVKYQTK